MLSSYWENYRSCLDMIRDGPDGGGVTVDELIQVCNAHFDKSVADAFFPNGADQDMLGTLMESGWTTVWVRADYYFAARDRNGATLTFVEGDIYRGTQRPVPANDSLED